MNIEKLTFKMGQRVLLEDGVTMGVCMVGADKTTYFVCTNGIHFTLEDIASGLVVVDAIYNMPEDPGKLLKPSAKGKLIWERDKFEITTKDFEALTCIKKLFPRYAWLGKGVKGKAYIYGDKPIEEATYWRESDKVIRIPIELSRFDLFGFRNKTEKQLFNIDELLAMKPISKGVSAVEKVLKGEVCLNTGNPTDRDDNTSRKEGLF